MDLGRKADIERVRREALAAPVVPIPSISLNLQYEAVDVYFGLPLLPADKEGGYKWTRDGKHFNYEEAVDLFIKMCEDYYGVAEESYLELFV